MELNKKIDILMKKKNIKNIKELSNNCKIPYTTLRSIMLDGVSDIRISTLSALANFFDVSTDYLLGNTTMENPKKEIEDYLSTLNLTEEEYSLYIENAIKTETLHLPTGNTRLDKVWTVLLQVYEDYLCTGYSKINIEDTDDYEKILKNNEPMDISFTNLLKSLDKNKILHKEQSNVFPTIDVPKEYPVLGKISAGLPLLAVENIEGYMYAPSSKIQQGYDYFFLRVQRR